MFSFMITEKRERKNSISIHFYCVDKSLVISLDFLSGKCMEKSKAGKLKM